MIYNDKKNPIKNKKGAKFSNDAYRHAIAMIESSGGKFLDTKTSSAAGKYHFLYNLIKNDPSMRGVSKREFINRPELQEHIMDKALSGKLKGYTYGEKYANKLKGEFNSDYDVNSLTAMVHFLGSGNARKFLKDPVNFRVPGAVNLTGDQYISKFVKHFNDYQEKNPNSDKSLIDGNSLPEVPEGLRYQQPLSSPKVPKGLSSKGRVRSERPYNTREIDKTSVDRGLLKKMASQSERGIQKFEQRQEELNNFKRGGQMTGMSGAQQLVTMFENGGSHEQNPLGGIPQGVGANGKTNLVEEGETKWNDYIFSNSYDMNGNFTGKDGKKSNVFEKGGNLNLLDTEPPVKKKKKIEEGVNELEVLGPESSGLIREYLKNPHTETNKRFSEINKSVNGSCLAGALNCGTGSSSNENYGYVNKFLPNKPSFRSYLDRGNVEKYRTNDSYKDDVKNLVPNTSIDAWEIHNYLRGEKLGYNPYEGINFTYNNHDILPDQVLENPGLLPVGTIIGQGLVKNKRGYEEYEKYNEDSTRNRHSMAVTGYDEKDGMPLIYDSGQERRLDDVVWSRNSKGDSKRITNFTTPNEYRDVTYENIKRSTKKRYEKLGYSGDLEKDYVSLGSSNESIKSIEKGANENSMQISDYYKIPKSSLDVMIKLLPGLSFSETKLNNNEGISDTILSDSFIGNTLGIKNRLKEWKNVGTGFMNLFRDDSKGISAWDHQIEFRKKNKGKKYSKEDEDNYIRSKMKENKGKKNYEEIRNSVGAFKIKDLSRFAKDNNIKKTDLYGMDVSNNRELELGSVAALSLLAEKYNEALKNTKKMGLKLTEEQLVKLSFVGYKSSSKMKSKKFIENFIMDKNNLGLSSEIGAFNNIKNYKVKQ